MDSRMILVLRRLLRWGFDRIIGGSCSGAVTRGFEAESWTAESLEEAGYAAVSDKMMDSKIFGDRCSGGGYGGFLGQNGWLQNEFEVGVVPGSGGGDPGEGEVI